MDIILVYLDIVCGKRAGHRLWQGNPLLIEDCRGQAGGGADVEPSAVINRALWRALQTADHVLRVVKRRPPE